MQDGFSTKIRDIRSKSGILLVLLLSFLPSIARSAAPPSADQNASPMTESTRAHERISETNIAGKRIPLSTGSLLVPENVATQRTMPLYIHFHGASWLVEKSVVAENRKAVVLSINLGVGSGVYSHAFADPNKFEALLKEAALAVDPEHPPVFDPVVISSYSAGYGAVREILKNHGNWNLIHSLVLVDGLHASYVPEGVPGTLDTASLQPFLEFAKEAVAGRKHLLITHSEIFPGAYASTTETADYLLTALSIKRHPVLEWGPQGMQQLSVACSGNFSILGFAGTSAPDHVDQLQGLEQWLKLIAKNHCK